MGVKSHYDAISKAYLPLGDSVTTFAHREFRLWAITLMQKIAATFYFAFIYLHMSFNGR